MDDLSLNPKEKLIIEQTKHWALKVKMLAGELVDANELSSSLGAVITSFRSRMQHAPKKIALALKNKYKDIDLIEAESIVEGYIYDALEELARLNPELQNARKRAIAKAADKSSEAEDQAEPD